MTIVNNLWEWPLRDFYDGVTTNRSGTLYENYQLYVDAGGQDTPALLELWREYLVSLGIMVVTSVQDARQYWIDNIATDGTTYSFVYNGSPYTFNNINYEYRN